MSATPATAFELTDDHQLETYGGTTNLGNGLHIDIGEALREGEGAIVTDDPNLVHILRERWDLRECQPPEGSRITSHQLARTTAEQHAQNHEVPAIGLAVDLTTDRDIVAAQARGDLPTLPIVAGQTVSTDQTPVADPAQPQQPPQPAQPQPANPPTPDPSAAAKTPPRTEQKEGNR